VKWMAASEEKLNRAFLAIELSAEVLSEISSIQARLKKAVQGTIRWVRPEAMHLTLKFLGDISENDIATISRVMADQAGAIKPFALDVGTLGAFPDMTRPRVIWLGIGGDVELLIRFQKSLDQALHGQGFPEEERVFSPHLTLARIKEPRGVIGLAKISEKTGKHAAGPFSARELVLFRSQLTPQGAIYSQLACFPFAG
jgi:2'-5' RNA ligase